MLSQWDCLLKNIGTWEGSFTHLSAEGQEIKDTPTVITFETTQNSQAIHQVVRYLPKDQPASDIKADYTPSSLSQELIFFENGSFCRGNTQWNGLGNFVSEFGLKERDRRLRIVCLFTPTSTR